MELALQPGDEIEYKARISHKDFKKRTGTVVQITSKLISLQGEKYPDSILLNDLDTGHVKIQSVNGQVFDLPEMDEEAILSQGLELLEKGLSIIDIAKSLNVTGGWLGKRLDEYQKKKAFDKYYEQRKQSNSAGWGKGEILEPEPEKGEETVVVESAIKNWDEIIKAGLDYMEAGSTPWGAALLLREQFELTITPQSIYPRLKKALEKIKKDQIQEPTVNQDPDPGQPTAVTDPGQTEQVTQESDKNMPEKGCSIDETAIDPTPPEEGFSPADDEPIPYQIGFIPNAFKFEIICLIRKTAEVHQAPANITLGLIEAILDVDLSEAG